MGSRIRRLPIGIGRGVNLEIDFRYHSKLYMGLYEVELNRDLRQLCYPGARCFDIGGNIGYDALVLANLSRGEVFTFEVDPQLCAVIERATAANPELAPSITVVCAFVADSTDDTSNQLSLDAFVQSRGALFPDLIKIDVEGGEASVLHGAEQILRKRRPGLIIETHGRQAEVECIEILSRYDYTPKIVDHRRWIPDYRPIRHNRWLVCRGAPTDTSP
jgi:hypothetical protein